MGEDPIAADLDVALMIYRASVRSVEPTAASLAKSLIDVAATCTLDRSAQLLLLSVARSLESPDARWKLSIRQAKRGRQTGYIAFQRDAVRDLQIAERVHKLEAEGWQTEAAVAEASTTFGFSRATIYAALKRVKDMSLGMRRMINEWKDGSLD